MILLTLPQTDLVAMPNTPTSEDRIVEGGLAFLSVMEKPAEKPTPALKDLPNGAEPEVTDAGVAVEDTPTAPLDQVVPAALAIGIVPEKGLVLLGDNTAKPSAAPVATPAQGAPLPLKTGEDTMAATAPALPFDGAKLERGRAAIPLPSSPVPVGQPTAHLAGASPAAAPPIAASPKTLSETKSAQPTSAAGDLDSAAPVKLASPSISPQPSPSAAPLSPLMPSAAVQPAVAASGGLTVKGSERSNPVVNSAQPSYPTAQTQTAGTNPPLSANGPSVAPAGLVPMFEAMEAEPSQLDPFLKEETGLLPSHTASHAGPLAATSLSAYQMARPTPPPVAYQLIEAFVRSEGGRTEIALNPEELGRVRFAMVATDAGMTLAITTERPETADLIRRNLEDLAREFRQMGFENLTFSFDDAPQDQRSEGAPSSQTENIAADNAPVMDEKVLLQKLRTGLDLKL